MPCIRIERDQNGFTVSATDPKIAEENQKPNSKWRDTERRYNFADIAGAARFIERIAEKAMPLETTPPDPFAAAFTAALKSEAKNDHDGDE